MRLVEEFFYEKISGRVTMSCFMLRKALMPMSMLRKTGSALTMNSREMGQNFFITSKTT